MFASSYFAPRYFAERYFPPNFITEEPTPPPSGGGGGRKIHYYKREKPQELSPTKQEPQKVAVSEHKLQTITPLTPLTPVDSTVDNAVIAVSSAERYSIEYINDLITGFSLINNEGKKVVKSIDYMDDDELLLLLLTCV